MKLIDLTDAECVIAWRAEKDRHARHKKPFEKYFKQDSLDRAYFIVTDINGAYLLPDKGSEARTGIHH